MNKIILWIMLSLTIVLPVFGSNSGFMVVDAVTILSDGEYRLNAQVDYVFTDAVLDALNNGVPLTIETRIKLRHKFAWFWEPSIVDIRKQTLIRYKPLTEVYTVTRLPAGKLRNFVTREAAIDFLGDIDGLLLLKGQALNPATEYSVYLKVSLDLEALPLPLRPIAHLTPSWNLSSGWTIWPLIP